jgi:hypothetical protein
MNEEEVVEVGSTVQKFYFRIPRRLKYQVNMIVLTNFALTSNMSTCYRRIC